LEGEWTLGKGKRVLFSQKRGRGSCSRERIKKRKSEGEIHSYSEKKKKKSVFQIVPISTVGNIKVRRRKVLSWGGGGGQIQSFGTEKNNQYKVRGELITYN